MIGFDLEKYLNHSRKVDLSEFDLASANLYPLTAAEVRCLEYMMDIELSTIGYLGSVLRTSIVNDPEALGFLSCWAYEEYFHGRAIREFLKAAGIDVHKDRCAQVRRNVTIRERLEEFGMSVMCSLTPHFNATLMTWGAVQEMTTLEAYGILAARTGNPILRLILLRLAKDERRHFAFYYNKARKTLEARRAQQLTTLLLRKFWTPVGSGVKHDPEVEWTMRFLFGGLEGPAASRRIDSTIARLPGLAWFDLFSQKTDSLMASKPTSVLHSAAQAQHANRLGVPEAVSASCIPGSAGATPSHSPGQELLETSD